MMMMMMIIIITLNSNTIIDLVFANFNFKVDVLNTPKISDHNIIKLNINNLENKNSTIELINKRDFRNFDSLLFCEKLNSKFTEDSFLYNNIEIIDNKIFNFCTDDIINKINLTMDEIAPLNDIKKRYSWEIKSWINRTIIEKIKIRDSFFFKAKKSGLMSDLIEYKRIKNDIVNLIRINKRNYYENTIDKNKRNGKKL